jgi:MmoB/DmpM family
MAVASDAAWVGPVLTKGRRADAVVAAIRELNENTEVFDRGAYLRVCVPVSCTVTRQAIERHAGEPFELPSDLEMIMPSFKGQLTLTEEMAEWSFGEGRTR